MKRWTFLAVVLLLSPGCPGDDDDDSGALVDDDDSSVADASVPWTSDLPSLEEDIGLVRGFRPLRSILHFHTVYSHDACDGLGYQEGVLDEECLAEMRDGLCRVRIDLAYVSDHPSYAAYHPFDDILLFREDDEAIVELMTVVDLFAGLNSLLTGLQVELDDKPWHG